MEQQGSKWRLIQSAMQPKWFDWWPGVFKQSPNWQLVHRTYRIVTKTSKLANKLKDALVRLSHEWSRSSTATFRLQAASLHQANVDWMSSCLYSTRWIVIGWASRLVVGCSYVGVFPGVFPYGRHPRFWDFDPVVPVDVVRVEADLDRFLDLASVPVWVSVNALDIVPAGAMSGRIGEFRYRRGLTAHETYISLVLLHPLLQWSSCLPDVYSVTLAARDPVYHPMKFLVLSRQKWLDFIFNIEPWTIHLERLSLQESMFDLSIIILLM